MYELRQLVIEPKRHGYRAVRARLGDRVPNRYEEGTIGLQSLELFHYRPTWAPDKELHDQAYSVLKTQSPDAFLDPRQFYYASYVIDRSQRADTLAAVVEMVQERELSARLSEPWLTILSTIVVPLRHYEAGAQLVLTDAARFAWGAPVASMMGLAAMDRLGNAQLLSEGGLSLPTIPGRESGLDWLAVTRAAWMEDPAQQPVRKMIEELLTERDWGKAVVGLDHLDRLLYPLVYGYLEAQAFAQGVSFYSLPAPFLRKWYDEQRIWLTALHKTWREDPTYGTDNDAALDAIAERWAGDAEKAVRALAERIDRQLGGSGASDYLDTLIKEATL